VRLSFPSFPQPSYPFLLSVSLFLHSSLEHLIPQKHLILTLISLLAVLEPASKSDKPLTTLR
jgi:hypothetical protein